eukprot:GHVS01002840.1.p1 GENE.GHVS01002840.1~~GHVS01002840.1.p1  ORF type:complete len:165 (-),score=0.61 GHVS01002840.1:276-770(-)
MNLFLVFLLLLHLALPACAIPDTCVLLFTPKDGTGSYKFSRASTPSPTDTSIGSEFLVDTVKEFAKSAPVCENVASMLISTDQVTLFKTYHTNEFSVDYYPATGAAPTTGVFEVRSLTFAAFHLVRCDAGECESVSVLKDLFTGRINRESSDGTRLYNWMTYDD